MLGWCFSTQAFLNVVLSEWMCAVSHYLPDPLGEFFLGYKAFAAMVGPIQPTHGKTF